MKNRINIAEVLTRCKSGIKLYDVLRGIPVIFDRVEYGNIYMDEEGKNEQIVYNKYATLLDVDIYPDTATMLIPSGNNPDWKHFFIPGDVLIHEDDNVILLVDKVSSDYRYFSALYAIDLCNNEVSQNFNKECNMDATLFSLVSAERAKDFINDLEERLNGKFDKETLKITLSKYAFKPKDWCLMRDIDQGYRQWILCQFSHLTYEDITYYVAVGGKEYTECIPYEGNEELLGTDKPTK